jgi:hypothetical protein
MLLLRVWYRLHDFALNNDLLSFGQFDFVNRQWLFHEADDAPLKQRSAVLGERPAKFLFGAKN